MLPPEKGTSLEERKHIKPTKQTKKKCLFVWENTEDPGFLNFQKLILQGATSVFEVQD